MSVGIERLAAYVPSWVLPIDALADARGVAREKLRTGLGVEAMAVPPPCEDVVTLAANAGARVLRAGSVSPDDIGLVLVATETAIDHAKPVAVFVHRLLGIRPQCRVVELKHACYSGTAALMIAADWVRAGGGRRRHALVIAADIARYPLRSAGEPTQGAGAVAMLVGNDADVLQLGAESGVFAAEVWDFWRPVGHKEALVDGKYSVECYLAALEGAFGAYRPREWPELGADEAFADRVAHLLFHAPFPKMAMKAHRRFATLDWQAAHGRWPTVEPRLEDAVTEAYAAQVAPGLEAVARIGNAYTASLYLCLTALLEREGRRLGGRRLGLFSYGSGSCAEFFTGTVPARVADVLDGGLARLLAERTEIDVPAYERALAAADAGGEPPDGFAGDFWFTGVRADRREYAGVVR
jgi:hydroxymethylglutaryl-CoA synthase